MLDRGFRPGAQRRSVCAPAAWGCAGRGLRRTLRGPERSRAHSAGLQCRLLPSTHAPQVWEFQVALGVGLGTRTL